MKKNILTIIIMAISLVNTALIALLIFSIVPAAEKTNKLVDKVAAIVDLELESPDAGDQVSVADIETYKIPEAIQCSLKSTDGTDHFMTVKVTLQQNKKNEDFEHLKESVEPNVDVIKEIVEKEFAKYTKEEVKLEATKEEAKKAILVAIQDYFDSDFIIGIALSGLLTQ